jgi:hypothetical protein
MGRTTSTRRSTSRCSGRTRRAASTARRTGPARRTSCPPITPPRTTTSTCEPSGRSARRATAGGTGYYEQWVNGPSQFAFPVGVFFADPEFLAGYMEHRREHVRRRRDGRHVLGGGPQLRDRLVADGGSPVGRDRHHRRRARGRGARDAHPRLLPRRRAGPDQSRPGRVPHAAVFQGSPRRDPPDGQHPDDDDQPGAPPAVQHGFREPPGRRDRGGERHLAGVQRRGGSPLDRLVQHDDRSGVRPVRDLDVPADHAARRRAFRRPDPGVGVRGDDGAGPERADADAGVPRELGASDRRRAGDRVLRSSLRGRRRDAGLRGDAAQPGDERARGVPRRAVADARAGPARAGGGPCHDGVELGGDGGAARAGTRRGRRSRSTMRRG